MYKYLQFSLSAILLSLLFFPNTAHSQMFSVGDPEPDRERSIGQFTILALGLEFADMSFAGDNPDNETLVDFNGNVLRVRLDSPGLQIGLGVGGSITGLDNASYVNVTGRLSNNFPLMRRSSFRLGFPFQITTDIKSVTSDNSDQDFQQSSLVFGGGLNSNIKLSNRFQLNASATPNFGFSFSQGGLFGGSLFRVDGKSELLVTEIFGNNALSIGYHFDYRRYRVDEGFNDYDYTSHSILIGIGF